MQFTRIRAQYYRKLVLLKLLSALFPVDCFSGFHFSGRRAPVAVALLPKK
jgi:hypothetical protein